MTTSIDKSDLQRRMHGAVEALKHELAYFVDCVVKNQTPLNDGAAGLRVVRLLEAAEESLKERGKTVCL